MNKFYKYLLPVTLLIVAFGISALMNNEFVLYIGWVISLIWLNRIGAGFQNKLVKILTAILLIVTIIWTAGLLLWASAW
ncbi:MAG TPA: hypothetical protein VJH63_02135 [Candidatus Paceibacterota bacterium]